MTNPPNPGVTLSLAGRTALITGGSRGIGAATVRLFRQAGARVAFSYRQAADQANTLSAACGGPDLCLPIQQSLETPEDGEALVARTLTPLEISTSSSPTTASGRPSPPPSPK